MDWVMPISLPFHKGLYASTVNAINVKIIKLKAVTVEIRTRIQI